MKISALPTVVVAALVCYVSAAPMKVVVVDVSAFRVGHPGTAEILSHPTAPKIEFAKVGAVRTRTMAMTRTRPCGSMRAKALDISNSVRKALGLPLIDPNSSSVVKVSGVDHVVFQPQRSIQISDHEQGPSFTKRLEMALMELGPWEGRFVTFILGCGIGVLIRMIWVLFTVSYRAFTKPNEEEVLFTSVDAEEIIVAPPRYELTYPDEKKDIQPGDKDSKDSKNNTVA